MAAHRFPALALLLIPTLIAACTANAPGKTDEATKTDAKAFLAKANDTALRLSNEASQATWVQQTYITQDTEALSSRANDAYVSAITDFAKQASKLENTTSDPSEKRQLMLLRNSQTMAAPADPKEATELSELVSQMDGMYGKGKYCSGEGDENCLDIEKITEILATSRDPKRIREVWEGWHTISPPMKPKYERFVELSNNGAKELGFADTGTMWRARYDMAADEFPKELDRLWDQLRPLYLSLHTYVRNRLHEKYGDQVPLDGPIPAHLLGNIWAQDWSNIYDIVAPPGSPKTYSLDDILKKQKKSPTDMVKYGEGFFTSMGFQPLPKTFWERSQFTKPRDRDVVCHASAWYLDNMDDLRVKVCIDQTAEDFSMIHHELGHLFYAREYNHAQPMLFRDSANDGFHEAIGDTLALSVTPDYLVKIGLLDKAPDKSADIPLLMRMALEKLAFLPFGFVVDQWRWQVFSGQVKPDQYNKAWWDLREKYQGIRPPSPRGEEFFDAGAKYHVPSNTPYARYFLAAVLQFQFHRALAKAAGCTEPLNRCSIYGNAAAGERLKKALAMGASRPWPDALEALTGERQMDATAIAEYFAPLKAWLDQQNQGKKSGW